MPIHRRTAPHGLTAGSAITGALLWCAVIIALLLIWNHPTGHDVNGDPQADRTGESDQSPGALVTEDPDQNGSGVANLSPLSIPDFILQECMGGEFGLADLKAKPWVASFVFTRCVTTCPQITLAMKNLQDRVAGENPNVMFVTLTVDSDFDNAITLKRYSETFEPDRSRWKFLTGDMQAIHDIIVNGFGVYVKENIGEARRPGMEVAHSNRVVLVNQEGAPVGKFLGTNADEMADLAGILLGRKPFPEPKPRFQFSAGDGAVELEVVAVESSEPEIDEQEAEIHVSEATDPDDDTPSLTTRVETVESESSVELRLAKIDRQLPGWAKAFPTGNAILNLTSAVLLTLGWLAIRRGHRNTHRNFMISAFVVSVVFLVCYLTSHWALAAYTGERGRPFSGGPRAGMVYYMILWPHVALAATVPFFAVRVFQHAAAERWDKHRRLARIAFPVWMYVSVTGVAIYVMLYHWPRV